MSWGGSQPGWNLRQAASKPEQRKRMQEYEVSKFSASMKAVLAFIISVVLLVVIMSIFGL